MQFMNILASSFKVKGRTYWMQSLDLFKWIYCCFLFARSISEVSGHCIGGERILFIIQNLLLDLRMLTFSFSKQAIVNIVAGKGDIGAAGKI